MNRRGFLLGALSVACPAVAQDTLPRTIRLLVPLAPGSSSDVLARRIAAKLAEALGVVVVVENRAAGGGLLAAQAVARAAPGGAMLLWGGQTAITNAVLRRDPGYDVLSDFTPIATIVENPTLLAVRSAAPWRDIAALLDAARAAPAGGLRYGSGGVGTPAHLAAAAMFKATGLEGTHVPYRGANQATLAVETGEVDFAFGLSNIVLPRLQQGVVRVLLSTAARRIGALPDVPTLAEQVPGAPVITSGSSILGPAGLPVGYAARVHAAVNRMLTEDASLRDHLIGDGGDINLVASPAAYAAAWPAMVSRMRQLFEVSGAIVE